MKNAFTSGVALAAMLVMSCLMRDVGSQEPSSPAVQAGPEQGALSIERVTVLLSAEKHLTNVLAVSRDAKHRDRDLYILQKQAMRVAGEKKLVDLVPQLILYLDYPADYFLAVAYDVPLREGPDAEANARKEWPAFDAILKIGAPATPHLEKFIDDPGEEARFRLAALETLEVIAPDKAEIAGKRLELSLREKGATNTLNKVEAVLQGKRHFWGVERRSD